MNPLRALFPPEDYRFRLTMRRGDPRRFFQQADPEGALLRERRRWLDDEPSRYAACGPGGEALLEELRELAAAWALPGFADAAGLGRAWEPDVLLLAPDAAGELRLRAGALCFPTGWALTEKLGGTLPEIHGVVPGLNPAIGGAIRQFLSSLKPGIAFHRDNWGIAATDELNLHPGRQLPRPTWPVRLEALWLRVEHQALVALPRSRGVLFGIRIALHRLDAVAADGAVSQGLARALRSLPEELAAYKGLADVRHELAARLTGPG